MKLAVGLEYNGTHFHGWQYQKNGLRTVQATVEKALSTIANHPVRVFCSGRTDAGVHAKEQVIHFQSKHYRPNQAWLLGTNCYLPSDVSCQWVVTVVQDFHARFSAVSRSYQYRIYNHPIRSAINHSHQTWVARKLDTKQMQLGANYLLGTHNFSAFRDSQCQAKSPIKTIKYLNISQKDALIFVDIQADAFLHHMVRNIVGTLFKVGLGDKPAEWVRVVLESQDRTQAGVNMPARGLYLMKINYPAHLLRL